MTQSFGLKLKISFIKRFLQNNGLESNTAWIDFFVENDRMMVEACSASGEAKPLLNPVTVAQDQNSDYMTNLCDMLTKLLRGSANTYRGAIERYLNTKYREGYRLRMFVNGISSHIRV